MSLVFVHGGVSGMERHSLPPLGHTLKDARACSSSLDAVETAVCALENDPALNAGYGAVLTRAGTVELDAGIAHAAYGYGAVTCVNVRNPVSLARWVMERTPHVFMAGDGAAELAQAAGLEPLGDTSGEQRARWERAGAAGALSLDSFGQSEHVDTVGAVAIGDDGRPAAASSTGGVFGKMPGRVGDSPVLGAGLMVTERASVLGTGVGELFLETLACARCARLIDEGAHPADACAEVVEALAGRRASAAGLLALDSEGRMGAAYRGGSWAVEGPDGPVDAACVGPAEE